MKKVLIWDKDKILSSSGGPAGYLFNIHEYLKDNPLQSITFYNDLLNHYDHTEKITPKKHNKLLSWLKQTRFADFIRESRSLYNLLIKKETIDTSIIDLNEYDVIHFHLIYDVLKYKNNLLNYRGVILITSHMPEPPIMEIASNCKFYGRLLFHFKDRIINRELNQLESLHPYWMFPTKYALEPYIEGSPLYKKYFSSINERIRYVTTSIMDKEIIRSKGFFAKYGIPSDSFVITYIGRHNRIKGYDYLKQIGEILLKSNKDIYIVVAGKEYPLKGLDNPRWIELGWISNSHEIIANSNLFILPNLQTYFDIVFLEVLRAGTPIVATKTGGNKHFYYDISRDETKGIAFIETSSAEIAADCILKYIQSYEESYRVSNRKLWERCFTMEVYIENYLKMLNTL